jgi:hypothetical protein
VNEKIELTPFHESIVSTINMAGIGEMQGLAYLIRGTKIPKNHDAIVAAWQKRIREVGLNSDLEVVASVLEQKEAELKKKTESYVVGKKPPGLADDGTFDTPAGIRASSIVATNGDLLVVDKETGLFVQDVADEDD